MKRPLRLIGVASLLLCVGNVHAEPIAKLAPLNSLGKQSFASQGKSEADATKDIPSREAVGLPAYPESYFAMAGGEGDTISTVSLMSKADPADVVSWYEKNLGSEWQNIPELATKQLGEVAVFVRSSKQGISAMDSLKYQQIRISKVEKPEDTGFAAMLFDVTDIKTMINMTVKPMM